MNDEVDWIDVSVPLYTGMVHWPDNPSVRFELLQDMSRGSTCNVSAISMGSHTGTHMDAPRHFVSEGQGIDQMPLDAGIGPARIIEIADTESIKPAELELYDIRSGERILFKTANSSRCWDTGHFVPDFVFIAPDAAQYLVDRRVRTVGVDYLSVASFKSGTETHQILLRAGIWLIEGLDLGHIRPGNYELICLPLRASNGDGAPARAVIRRRT